MNVLIKSRALLAASVTTALLAFSSTASAFADDDARRAILELREQIRQITEQNQQARLHLADRIETLQQEVANLRGQIERMRFELDIKDGRGLGLNQDTPQVSNPQEQAAFDKAMNFFRGGQYKEAAESFGTFSSNYPNSQLTADARFYRGSSLYASKSFGPAITELQAMEQSDPDHPRAPDALLIVAAAQIEQNNLSGARDTLRRIVDKYPQSNAAQTAQERLKLLQ
ncbi:MAG: tol-pal system protein YbgF [Pusillimonas sp.]|jgi:tol-pal system protein YbgF|nr:tol-pal system protein YbgF [Pusillimonas sp.]